MSDATVAPKSIPVPEPDLTPAQMIARAQALVPMLREQQDDAERRGYYGPAVHEAFLQAGCSRIIQPRRFGGYEFDLGTFLRTMVAIATGDPATGWCLTLGCSHAWLAASHFDEQAQAEMFAPDGDFRCPHPVAPTGRLTPVEGGYRLTGRWPYASGIPYATWAFAGAAVVGPDGEPGTETWVAAIPRRDLTMLDDWGEERTIGMSASGSNTFVVEDVFVSERFAMPWFWFDPPLPSVGVRLHGNPLYIGRAAAPYHASLVAPVVGAARAALDEFRALITTRPTTFHPHVLRARFHEDQRAYGQAMAMTDGAETILYGFADQYLEAAASSVQSGVPIELAQDARWWALLQQAGGLGAGAVELLTHRASSSASGRGQRLGRYFRDVTTYRQHVSAQQGDFAWRNAALYLGESDRWLF